VIPLNKFVNWFSVQKLCRTPRKAKFFRDALSLINCEPEGEHSFKEAQDQKEVNLGDIKIYEIL
jgi:hypothetical protein